MINITSSSKHTVRLEKSSWALILVIETIINQQIDRCLNKTNFKTRIAFWSGGKIDWNLRNIDSSQSLVYYGLDAMERYSNTGPHKDHYFIYRNRESGNVVII